MKQIEEKDYTAVLRRYRVKNLDEWHRLLGQGMPRQKYIAR